jgi:hypothetical protein
MYYPSQSPGLKMQGQYDHWPRGQGGAQGGLLPASPYGGMYASPAMHLHQGAHPLGTHPGALAHHAQHYASPPPGHVPHQPSPGTGPTETITPHWQQQLMKCEVRIVVHQINQWSILSMLIPIGIASGTLPAPSRKAAGRTVQSTHRRQSDPHHEAARSHRDDSGIRTGGGGVRGRHH